MRVDAHQHFWRYSAEEYDWIDDSMQGLKRDCLPVDLQPLLAANGLDACVAVQARQSDAETDWLLELAAQNDFIAGVVGWTDLSNPELETRLAHYATSTKLKGFRHVLQGEEDGFMLEPEFIAGVAKLAESGLCYDILVFERQLESVRTLVSELPVMPLVIDHIAKPDIANGSYNGWARHMADIAQNEHVYCKVSGMVTEADWQGWSNATFERYLGRVFECFGENRVMFGSDWPVCTVAGGYASIVGIVAEFVAKQCHAAEAAVFGGTATRFYTL